MKRTDEKSKGITMVALVVTIIVLLILASIAISLTIGNNGLFTKSKEGAKKYTIEDYRETLELLRANPEMDRANKNLDSKGYMDIYEVDVKNEVKLKNAEVLRKEDDKVRVITKEGYVFDITENEIKYIGIYGETPLLSISHTINPEESVKAEEVTINIKATEEMGISSVVNITTSNITKVNNTTYIVNKNGKYIFEVKDKDGNLERYTVNILNVGTRKDIEIFSYMRQNNMTPTDLGFTYTNSNPARWVFSQDMFYIGSDRRI